MARPAAKKTKKSPKVKKSSVKRTVGKRAGKQIVRISKKQRAEWESKTQDEQTQYLKDHPDSRFQKLGVTKKDLDSTKSIEPKAEDTEEKDTETQDNPLKTPRNVEESSDQPFVPALDPKKSVAERIKDALNSVKDGFSNIRNSAREGYSEGLNEALNNPLKLEEIQKRQAEYRDNPPKKPRDGHDKLMLLMGVAGVVAFGALAVAAPGLAIVAGMSLAEHSPDLVRAISEHASRRREERAQAGESWDDDKELPSIIGDTIEEHAKKAQLKGAEYFEERRKELEEANSEALNRLEKKWDGDSNWKDKNPGESSPEVSKENNSSSEQKTSSETGDDTEQKEKTDEANTSKNRNGVAETNKAVDSDIDAIDEEYDDEDDEEDEPLPPKKRGRGKRVESNLLETVRAGFTDLTLVEHPLQKTIDRTVVYIESLLRQRDRKNVDKNASPGTYAALKLNPSSARLLADWAKKKGIKNAYPAGEYHITICYSKAPIDYKPLSFIHGGREVKPRELGLLGREEDKKYLVLHLQPEGFPHRRFRYARAIGATHDFPNYLPHISIAPPGHGFTEEDLGSFNFDGLDFPLMVDYEYSDELRVQSNAIPDQGYITNKPNPVRAQQMNDSGTITFKDNTYKYKRNDYILKDTSGEQWVVRADIFKSKYVQQNDGTWDKKPLVLSYRVVKANTIVQTLEGPVKAKQGDYIITGTKGEEWPVNPKRFDQLYSVVVDQKTIR